MDSDKRPERTTAIVGHELGRYNIAIAALSETRRADTGTLKEIGAGYTFFWSGKSEGESRESGVGFAIRNDIATKLDSLPKGLSDRLMTLRVSLSGNTHLTLISVHAPTMMYSDKEKECFYASLRDVIHTVPANDKLLVLGDFNARVGNNKDAWPGVLGPHGHGNVNSNGLLLLSLCSEENLVITNTVFQHCEAHKVTWMHPRSKHWHMIDHIITRRRDLEDILDTRAFRGADCWTDHILLRCKARFKIHQPLRKKSSCIKKKLNVSKLKCNTTQTEISSQLAHSLANWSPDKSSAEVAWSSFRDTVFTSAEASLGYSKKKHQDWFDQNDTEILQLINKKRAAHVAWLCDKSSSEKHALFKKLRGQVQAQTRALKDSWWAEKAEEIQDHANKNQTKEFFSGLKSLFGPPSCATTPIRNSEGTLLTDKKDILNQWTLHFSSLLNRTSNVTKEALDSIPQRPIIHELENLPTEEETANAVKQLQIGKAPGPDGIPPEVFKSGGQALIHHLTRLFQHFWELGELPQDFRDANIVHLYKNKGDKSLCDNHRGISLLSIAGKIFARILLNRISKHLLDDVVSESQCGFRKERGTVDMIFSIRQLQEKCLEQHQDLHLLFIDLTKAFDTVSRPGLWAVLGKLGCPAKFVQLIRSFHDGMLARVIENGEVSDSFPVSNGVKQGCVLAPTLFSLLFAQMLAAALQECDAGINIHYRTDGPFFNLRRLRSRTKVKRTIVRDFLFADDCALAAHTEEDLQKLADCFSTASKAFGLTVSIKKTEVLRQLAPSSNHPPPNITMDGNSLNNVESFKYLGSCINSSANLDDEVLSRLSKANQAFGRLHTRVWKERGLTTETKLKVYSAVVLPSLLYGCESWTCYKRHIRKLDQFHLRCLRRILHVSWEDRITNQEILRRAGCLGIEALLKKAQLRWTGHVLRMSDNRLPKQLFHSELSQGCRQRGGQRLRFKDNLKTTLKQCNIQLDQWQHQAEDRPRWRSAIHAGVNLFEEQRLDNLDKKRLERKSRSMDLSTGIACPTCGRICASAFGLRSHQRRH